MFTTALRGRGAQRESPPMPGTDSTYGVRSVSEWGGDSAHSARSGDERAQHSGYVSGADERGDSVDGEAAGDDCERAGEESSTTVHIDGMREDAKDWAGDDRADSTAGEDTLSATPSPRPLPLSSLAPSAQIIPPSPDDTAHSELDTDSEADTGDMHLSLHLREAPSEPSSPASYTSMPSYVASISSVSRTSSPTPLNLGFDTGYTGYTGFTGFAGRGVGTGTGTGSEELVLPTLSLPSSSLHLSLRRWEGTGARGIRVALLGSGEMEKKLVRALGEREDLVDMGRRGEIGVVRNGKIAATLITGLDGDQIHARVNDVYTRLHHLLHPSPPTGAHEQMSDLIDGYTSKSDWFHIVLALDSGESSSSTIRSLAPLVPVMCPDSTDHSLPLFTLEHSRAPTPSPPKLDEPTPMPMSRVESSSYFIGAHDTSNDASGDTTQVRVRLVLSLLDEAPSIMSASTSKFLAWRPESASLAPLEASQSSFGSSTPASASSAFDMGSAPMPTVARAQGGGEWEANLSRRIAKRRESDEFVRGIRARGRGRRRSSNMRRDKDKKASCAPLFPKIPGTGSKSHLHSLGLRELVEKTFAPVRGLFGKRGWTGVVLVAVAVAVGTWWVSRK